MILCSKICQFSINLWVKSNITKTRWNLLNTTKKHWEVDCCLKKDWLMKTIVKLRMMAVSSLRVRRLSGLRSEWSRRCTISREIWEGSSLGLALGKNSLTLPNSSYKVGNPALCSIACKNMIVEFLLTPVHCLVCADNGSVCAASRGLEVT